MRCRPFCFAGLFALVAVGLVGATDRPAAPTQPEAKPAASPRTHRPSDVVFILIETSAFDEQAQIELQQMYDVLRKLDKDGTGKIAPAALKHARRQIITDRADYLIGKLDTDGDGKISREEAQGRIREHFERIDSNGDGFIDRAELIHAIAERPRHADQ